MLYHIALAITFKHQTHLSPVMQALATNGSILQQNLLALVFKLETFGRSVSI